MEARGGKVLFTEDNQPRVRNIDSVVIQFVDGTLHEISPFSGWVTLTTGARQKRKLEVALSSADQRQLVQSKWSKLRFAVCVFFTGSLTGMLGLLFALAL